MLMTDHFTIIMGISVPRALYWNRTVLPMLMVTKYVYQKQYIRSVFLIAYHRLGTNSISQSVANI